MTTQQTAITLSQLAQRIKGALTRPDLTNVWVVAELVDCNLRRGHFYFDLIEKDASGASIQARIGGVIWGSAFPRVRAEFMAATRQDIVSGMKVMVCGSLSFHPSFGMKFVVTAINPSYTLGEAERRRREILLRLKQEGMLDLNRSLPWPVPVQRIAVISAAGAAGFGDFCHQLAANPSKLRFVTRLFPAMMQGEKTVPSVIAALEQIADELDRWDCVVIIRGGGATSDLMAFDDYDLAANVAQFPIPVIVGIGHERDTTVLDYVASMRVKTPTAAAEWLISQGEQQLELLRTTAASILQTLSDRLTGCRQQLAFLESSLQTAPATAIERNRARLQRDSMILAEAGARKIAPMLERLNNSMQAIAIAASNVISRQEERLKSRRQLLDALSPQATLNRGYSITLVDGKAVRNPDDVPSGVVITTRVAAGSFESVKK